MNPEELLALFGATQAPAPAPQSDLGPLAQEIYGGNQDYDSGMTTDFQPVVHTGMPEPAGVMPNDPVATPISPPIAPTGPAPQTPVSTSQSASFSGYSPAQAAAIEAGPYGQTQYDKTRNKHEAAIRGDYADEQAAMQQADQAQLLAADQVGNAEAEQITARARLEGERGKLLREQESGLRAIYESGAVASRQAKNEYLMRLAAIPEVNPNALWDEAGAEGQFQMGLAAVIHGMLGVKGINTTAMDTINSAIKNKIAAQVENINTKKQVAAGFKDLWEMTVAESASRAEAEAKMHGYMLKAFEAGMDAEMGKIDSNLARAKHAYAKGQLQQAQVKNRVEVERFIQQGVDQAMQQETQRYIAGMQAATARAQMASNERIASGKNKDTKGPRLVFDPETKKGKWIFHDWVKDEQAAKILEGVGKFDAANETMQEIRQLERKMKPVFDPLTGTRLAPEDARRYNALVTQLAHDLVAARGERPTDKDVEQQLKSLPTKTDFTRGAVDKILADTQAGLRRNVAGVVGQFVTDVPENMQPSGPNMKNFAEGSATDVELTRNGTTGQTAAEAAVARVLTPEAAYVSKPPGSKQTNEKEWKDFTVPYWKEFLSGKSDFIEKHGKHKDTGTSGAIMLAGGMSPESPPAAFDAVRELAEDALAGDQDSKKYLVELSASSRSSDLPPALQALSKTERDAIAAYADYFSSKLNSVDGTDGHQEFGYEENKPVTRPR